MSSKLFLSVLLFYTVKAEIAPTKQHPACSNNGVAGEQKLFQCKEKCPQDWTFVKDDNKNPNCPQQMCRCDCVAEWFGTRPFCDGDCPPGYTEIKRADKSETQYIQWLPCITGTKALCRKCSKEGLISAVVIPTNIAGLTGNNRFGHNATNNYSFPTGNNNHNNINDHRDKGVFNGQIPKNNSNDHENNNHLSIVSSLQNTNNQIPSIQPISLNLTNDHADQQHNNHSEFEFHHNSTDTMSNTSMNATSDHNQLSIDHIKDGVDQHEFPHNSTESMFNTSMNATSDHHQSSVDHLKEVVDQHLANIAANVSNVPSNLVTVANSAVADVHNAVNNGLHTTTPGQQRHTKFN